MSLLPTPNPTTSAPVLRARLASRGPAQASPSNSLGGNGAGEDPSHAATARRRASDKLFHFGTEAHDPLWNGPRLNPAFVAQVLGQVMMEPQASTSAPAAYRRAAAQIAPGAFYDSGS